MTIFLIGIFRPLLTWEGLVLTLKSAQWSFSVFSFLISSFFFSPSFSSSSFFFLIYLFIYLKRRGLAQAGLELLVLNNPPASVPECWDYDIPDKPLSLNSINMFRIGHLLLLACTSMCACTCVCVCKLCIHKRYFV